MLISLLQMNEGTLPICECTFAKVIVCVLAYLEEFFYDEIRSVKYKHLLLIILSSPI